MADPVSQSLSRMSKSARKMSESVVEGQHKVLFRFSGGLTLLTFKPYQIDMKLFREAMTKTGLMTPDRFDELYEQIEIMECEEQGLSSKTIFIELVSSEILIASQKDYVDALQDGLASVIALDEFGKRKFIQDTTQGYGIYKISKDSMYGRSERQTVFNIVDDYNYKKGNEERPSYERTLPSPFPKFDSNDEKYFDGDPFTVEGFQMTEFTKYAAMADFGFPDWETSTGNKLLFCYRKGEIFVLTTGRAADVIVPHADPTFVPKISEWIRSVPRNLVQKTALFNNRHKSYDLLLSLSMMARVVKGETLDLEPMSTVAVPR